jgi:hypothetical protein
MADTKEGRENQADNAERRQRERELAEALDRADEPDPTADDQTAPGGVRRERGEEEDRASTRECHRRGCTDPATFLVLERYQEETGHGAVESEAALCREHTAEESPTNLDGVYPEYVFRVVPIPEPRPSDTT